LPSEEDDLHNELVMALMRERSAPAWR